MSSLVTWKKSIPRKGIKEGLLSLSEVLTFILSEMEGHSRVLSRMKSQKLSESRILRNRSD